MVRFFAQIIVFWFLIYIKIVFYSLFLGEKKYLKRFDLEKRSLLYVSNIFFLNIKFKVEK